MQTLQLLLTVIVLAALTGACAHSRAVLDKSARLDGGWRLARYECAGGTLNKRGQSAQKQVASGEFRAVALVAGDKATTHWTTYIDFSKGLDRCESVRTERWRIGKDSVLQISDSDQVSKLIASETLLKDRNWSEECKTLAEEALPDRDYDYELTATALKLISKNGAAAAWDVRPFCDSGKFVFVYERVL